MELGISGNARSPLVFPTRAADEEAPLEEDFFASEAGTPKSKRSDILAKIPGISIETPLMEMSLYGDIPVAASFNNARSDVPTEAAGLKTG